MHLGTRMHDCLAAARPDTVPDFALPLRVHVRRPRRDDDGWARRCMESLARLSAVRVVESDAEPADLIVDLGAPSPDRARTGFGCWSFVDACGDGWEHLALRAHVECRLALQVQLVASLEGQPPQVLEEGVFRLVPHSLNASRARIRAALSTWPARAIARLLGGSLPAGTRSPLAARSPSGIDTSVLRAAVPLASLWNMVARVMQDAQEAEWCIGVIPRPVHHCLEHFDAREIRWCAPLPDGYLADPFGVQRADGTLLVLAERVLDREGRGTIVRIEIGPDGTCSPPTEVLRLPVHTSYPFIVQHEGATYVVPEIGALGRVQLFRTDPSLKRLEPDRVLLPDFAGSDATLLRWSGRWWMFAGDRRDQDTTKLYVFHAPDLFGPWEPHAMNPVKCDLRSARPAGPPFVHDGELYRPAQDCSRTYGGGVAINRVVRLTPTEFHEETVRVLRPDPAGPWPDGLHTLAGIGDVTLVDGKRHSRSLRRIVAAAARLVRGARERE